MCIRTWLRCWLQEPSLPTQQSAFETALAHYKVELKALEARKPPPVALLAVLLCRDRVAVALAEEPASAQAAQYLADLDCRLRRIASRVSKAGWQAWRQALNPPSERWWWRLDETHDFPWVLLAGVLMTATLSLTVDIIRRIWGGGPDLLSIVSTILTLVLTSSPLTKQGRELAGWLMDRVRLPTRYWGRTMPEAAGLAFVVTLFLRLMLPAVAVACNNRGYALLSTGDLTGAQRAFARAVSINPDYAAGYYNLADAYVEIGDDERAIALYNQALAADRTLDLAYNGLGYALILRGEPERAIPVLYIGLSLAQDDVARAALWTNLGRAYWEASRYHEAEAALAKALALGPEEAAAHCTLALTTAALERTRDQVMLHWENCLRYADPTTPRGQELAALARAHLQQLKEER